MGKASNRKKPSLSPKPSISAGPRDEAQSLQFAKAGLLLKILDAFKGKGKSEDASVAAVIECMEVVEHQNAEALTKIDAAARGVGRKVACKEGCNYCCHVPVTSSVPELVAIKRYIDANFSEQEKADLYNKVATYCEQSAAMTGDDRFFSARPCPMLVEGRCSIYAVRPFPCRGCHSTNVRSCQRGYEATARRELVAIPMVNETRHATKTMLAALVEGFQANGLRLESLKFIESLKPMLDSDDMFQRWVSGEDVFVATKA